MSTYVTVIDALRQLADGRIFPLVADPGVETPYIVLQRAGGASMQFLSGELPEKKHRRIQVSVWARSALEAEALAAQVELALCGAPGLQTEVLGEPVDTIDELTTYRGTRQEFYLFC